MGLFLRMGDHSEWGVAGQFSLSTGEWTTLARGKGTWEEGIANHNVEGTIIAITYTVWDNYHSESH